MTNAVQLMMVPMVVEPAKNYVSWVYSESSYNNLQLSSHVTCDMLWLNNITGRVEIPAS